MGSDDFRNSAFPPFWPTPNVASSGWTAITEAASPKARRFTLGGHRFPAVPHFFDNVLYRRVQEYRSKECQYRPKSDEVTANWTKSAECMSIHVEEDSKDPRLRGKRGGGTQAQCDSGLANN